MSKRLAKRVSSARLKTQRPISLKNSIKHLVWKLPRQSTKTILTEPRHNSRKQQRKQIQGHLHTQSTRIAVPKIFIGKAKEAVQVLARHTWFKEATKRNWAPSKGKHQRSQGGKQGKKNVQTCGKMRFLVKANVTNKEPSQPPSQ